MTRQRVIQTYKPSHAWCGTPPGIALFAACHLSNTCNTDLDLRFDVSQTGAADVIHRDDTRFQVLLRARPPRANISRTIRRCFRRSPRFANRRDGALACSNMGA